MYKRARCGVLAMLFAWLTAGSARGESICLHIAANGAPPAVFLMTPGDKIAIHFSHSLYGSAVEEEFYVAARGFRANQLRYGEPRLVEFYGHESSREENGMWIVDQRAVDIEFLDLHVSFDAAIRIVFGDRVILLGDSTADMRTRLFVGVCPVEKDDR
jgi:hypothetical protein